MAHKLLSLFPANIKRYYIEPFAGSACLFFKLQPSQAILGDLNKDLIVTMRAIQRDVELVLQCLRRLRKGKRAYYAVRSKDHSSLSDAETAARFIYLNRYCFNGLYRTNTKGMFNVPYGPQKGKQLLNEQQIMDAARALQSVIFLHGDFEKTLSYANAGDFVYLDPPYAINSRRVFSQYFQDSFNSRDLERLGEALNTLHCKKVTFLITYADSSEARKLLSPWNPRRIWTRRNIAGFAGHRRGAYELVATNAPEGLPNAY